MSRFNSNSYDPQTKIATVGTGQKWETVYAALEQYNVSVAGGRIADVGVGGFTLGGGYSWISNQVGLTCDTVVEFEAVLPTGKIVTVNKSSYPDLFFGLKVSKFLRTQDPNFLNSSAQGGGNQFGIVTTFKFNTHVQPAVYVSFFFTPTLRPQL